MVSYRYDNLATYCTEWHQGWPLARFALHGSECRAPERRENNKEIAMPVVVTWDHVHLRSPDPEATATWLRDILGGEIVRGPGRIDVQLGGARVFIAEVTQGDGVNAPPVTPYQGLDHFGLSVKDIDAVAAEIKAKGVEVIVYEPELHEETFFGSRVVRDLEAFKAEADVIVANRRSPQLADVEEKIYTRDLFGSDS